MPHNCEGEAENTAELLEEKAWGQRGEDWDVDVAETGDMSYVTTSLLGCWDLLQHPLVLALVEVSPNFAGELDPERADLMLELETKVHDVFAILEQAITILRPFFDIFERLLETQNFFFEKLPPGTAKTVL